MKKLTEKDLQLLDKLVAANGGYLYHGSPVKLKTLSGSANKTPGADNSVFVTPFKDIARMMAPSGQRDIVDPIEKQLGKKHIAVHNIGYSGWSKPGNGDDKPIDIRVSTPEEFTKFTGKAQTYLHRIAYNTIRDRLRRWKYAEDNTFNEFIIPGEVEVADVDKIDVPFVVRKDPDSYERPYTAERLQQLGLGHLLKDPAHAWRAKTGIELVHREPDIDELTRIYKNWQKMSIAAKKRSDKKSRQLFGKTNEEHYKELLRLYN